MPGPLPNPSARRRNAGGAFVVLPFAGRRGATPPWPTPEREDGLAARRASLWRELWASPTAALWERQWWTHPVARYVELILRVETDPAGASGALLTELRRMEDALALSASGALRARAILGEPTPGAASPATASVVDLNTWRPPYVTTDAGPATPEPVDLDAPRAPGPAC